MLPPGLYEYTHKAAQLNSFDAFSFLAWTSLWNIPTVRCSFTQRTVSEASENRHAGAKPSTGWKPARWPVAPHLAQRSGILYTVPWGFMGTPSIIAWRKKKKKKINKKNSKNNKIKIFMGLGGANLEISLAQVELFSRQYRAATVCLPKPNVTILVVNSPPSWSPLPSGWWNTRMAGISPLTALLPLWPRYF